MQWIQLVKGVYSPLCVLKHNSFILSLKLKAQSQIGLTSCSLEVEGLCIRQEGLGSVLNKQTPDTFLNSVFHL